jgi:hypothetical protein
LYREIRGIRTDYNFSSDARLKNDISSLIKSIEERGSLLKETEEELVLVILMKIYLTAEGYRNVFISSWTFSQSLSSNEKEREKLEKIIAILIDRKFVVSKALGRISITHQGIKKIEELLENSYTQDYISHPVSQFLPSIGEVEKSK